MYGSATTAGTRPGSPIAAAWATMQHLGRDGYEAKARVVRDTTAALRAGIEAIDGVVITGDPDMSLFEFGHADGAEATGALGDGMDDRGWNLDRQQGGLHLMISPGHAHIVEEFLADLGASAAAGGESRGVKPSYGGVAE